jgi:hypothetical protein
MNQALYAHMNNKRKMKKKKGALGTQPRLGARLEVLGTWAGAAAMGRRVAGEGITSTLK